MRATDRHCRLASLRRRLPFAAAAACALAAAVPSAAPAAPASVKVRVEGATSTLLSRTVTTDAKTITMPAGPNFSGAPFGGGSFLCNGQNHATVNPAGATPTTALDDAAHAAGVPWYGPFDGTADDFSLDTIAGEGAASLAGPFFDVRVNYAPITGGCTTRIFDGDEVLFALDGAGKPALKLAGPTHATTGETLTYTVTDGATDAAVSGATVGDQATSASGTATISFPAPGVFTVRADKPGAIRSSAISVCVDGADGTPCTSPGGGGTGTGSDPATTAPTTPSTPTATTPVAPAAPESTPPVCDDPTPDGRCDTPRQQAPQARIGSYKDGSVIIADRTPWIFSGTVGWPSRLDRAVMFSDVTGTQVVKLRLTRTYTGQCQYFSGRLRHFRKMNDCGATRGFWFAISSPTANWSYAMPRALKAGRYVLDVNAVDGWGRRDNGRRRGENRVVFKVAG